MTVCVGRLAQNARTGPPEIGLANPDVSPRHCSAPVPDGDGTQEFDATAPAVPDYLAVAGVCQSTLNGKYAPRANSPESSGTACTVRVLHGIPTLFCAYLGCASPICTSA